MLYKSTICRFPLSFVPPPSPRLVTSECLSDIVQTRSLCQSVSQSVSQSYNVFIIAHLPIPVAARSQTWVFGRSLCWDCGFKSRRGHGCLSLMIVVCCQGEVSASGWTLVQRSPTACRVSEFDREASRTGKARIRKRVEKCHIKTLGNER
jgi:hypothetical protein